MFPPAANTFGCPRSGQIESARFTVIATASGNACSRRKQLPTYVSAIGDLVEQAPRLVNRLFGGAP